jgi:hypothetical protein
MSYSCDTDTRPCFGLKEWFTLCHLLHTPVVALVTFAYITEESVALFQAATDEPWGADCAKMLEAISVYDFDRHFQVARSTGFKADFFFAGSVEVHVAEKTGNIQHCIEINDRKYRAAESYLRAAPLPGQELPYFLWTRASFLGVEAHLHHLQPRANLSRHFRYAGINSIQQAEEGYRSSADWEYFRKVSKSSADGIHHIFPEHVMVALIRTVLHFSAGTRDVDMSWLDDLPPADATTLHDTGLESQFWTTVRVLVAEVLEQQGRHADAIHFVQTDLQDYHNLNVPAKVRAGRVLGRCHAALGQHMLSISAFDAAIDLARSRKLLLSEALAVRGRASTGRNGTGESSGVHWNDEVGRQRLAEVMDRMQGPRDALESALSLPR